MAASWHEKWVWANDLLVESKKYDLGSLNFKSLVNVKQFDQKNAS